jgi:hypothetical protein
MTRFHLDVIDVREPCTEDWSRMDGDERVRSCATCKSSVYNLSSMTRAEVDELMMVNEGRVCVRFYRRADGTVSTLDCAPRRMEALRRKARVGLGAGAVLVAGALGLMGALGIAMASDASSKVQDWAAKITHTEVEEPMLMGEPAWEPPPEPSTPQ